MTTKALAKDEIAKLMGCKQSCAISRLVALGYTIVCSRCGGSGRYSWNAINRDTCFGCNGAGKGLAKITAVMVAEALERIKGGELDAYFAEHTARREIDAANKALWADYMKSAIGAAYDVGFKSHSRNAMKRALAGLEPYGPENDLMATPAGRAQTFQNSLMDRASKALYDRKAPHAARIAIIREVHAMILELNRIWSTMEAA